MLFASLAVAWLVPPESLLIDPPELRYVLAAVLAFAPVFFANLVFSHSFRDTRTADMAFASNLLGAMVGGALEYLALITGYQALLLVVAALYGLAWLFATRFRRMADRDSRDGRRLSRGPQGGGRPAVGGLTARRAPMRGGRGMRGSRSARAGRSTRGAPKLSAGAALADAPAHRRLLPAVPRGGVVVMASIVLTALIGIINPYLLKLLIDEAIPNQDFAQLNLLVGLMIVLPIISGLIGVGQTYLNNVVGQHVMQDLRNALYAHLQQMPLRFFTETRTGEIQSRLANDVGGVQSVVTDTASSVFSNLITVGRHAGRDGLAELAADAHLARGAAVLPVAHPSRGQDPARASAPRPRRASRT